MYGSAKEQYKVYRDYWFRRSWTFCHISIDFELSLSLLPIITPRNFVSFSLSIIMQYYYYQKFLVWVYWPIFKYMYIVLLRFCLDNFIGIKLFSLFNPCAAVSKSCLKLSAQQNRLVSSVKKMIFSVFEIHWYTEWTTKVPALSPEALHTSPSLTEI